MLKDKVLNPLRNYQSIEVKQEGLRFFFVTLHDREIGYLSEPDMLRLKARLTDVQEILIYQPTILGKFVWCGFVCLNKRQIEVFRAELYFSE